MFQTAFKDKNKKNLEKELKSFGRLFLPLPAVYRLVISRNQIVKSIRTKECKSLCII